MESRKIFFHSHAVLLTDCVCTPTPFFNILWCSYRHVIVRHCSFTYEAGIMYWHLGPMGLVSSLSLRLCMCVCRYWDSQTGLEQFRVQTVSQSQAWQRAGRAGREASGVCLRLYTDQDYQQMPLHPQPEMLRAPLNGVLLNLCSMHITVCVWCNFIRRLLFPPSNVLLWKLTDVFRSIKVTRLGWFHTSFLFIIQPTRLSVCSHAESA